MKSLKINEFLLKADDIEPLELDLFMHEHYKDTFTVEENLILLDIFKLCRI